ncbi:phosphoribosylformylglycinamidine cyclo-ligase [Candidatus Methanophagaceae archaeon]|nr:phosphoribosylformylglycinamidine cyclo-ligase [Methanophagales archaeon]
MSEVMTYSKAGVDIEEENKFISTLIKNMQYTRKNGLGVPLNISGHYAGLIEFGDYALALATDGVGSKVIVADEMQKWDTIGIDCVAMNVNDIICVGAEPLAFVDYLAIEKKMSPEKAEQIGIGLNKGAELANISIIGGETASLPEIVKSFDLAGTCLGYVKKNDIIIGENVEIGDVIVGLRSSGIHSNGLTLARKVFKNAGYSLHDPLPDYDSGLTIGEALLEPTKIYVREVLHIIKKYEVHGLAHISGSGLRKIQRLPKEVEFNITKPFEPHEIFKIIQKVGKVTRQEMYNTFNMGLGFCIVASKSEGEDIVKSLRKMKVEAQIVGRIRKGKGLKYLSSSDLVHDEF